MPTGGSAKTPAALLKDYEKSKTFPKSMSGFARLVFAIVSDHQNPLEAAKAIGRIEKNFIDWNECRVSRWVEIARAVDPMADSDKIAMRLRDMLNRLFDQRGGLNLEFCIDMKVTEARKALCDLDAKMPKAQVNLILYEYHPTMTLPISADGLEVAKKFKLIPASGEKSNLQKKVANMEQEDVLKLLHYLEAEALLENSKKKSTGTKKTAKKKRTVKKVK